jgi:hypothetical protein
VAFKVCQTFVERSLHEDVVVQDQTIEDEEFDDRRSVGVFIFNQLSVEDRVRVEAVEGWIFVMGKMQPRHVIVVILSINQVMYVSVAVLSQVHEVSESVGFLADIVVFGLENLNMLRGKGNWLGAWKGTTVS